MCTRLRKEKGRSLSRGAYNLNFFWGCQELAVIKARMQATTPHTSRPVHPSPCTQGTLSLWLIPKFPPLAAAQKESALPLQPSPVLGMLWWRDALFHTKESVATVWGNSLPSGCRIAAFNLLLCYNFTYIKKWLLRMFAAQWASCGSRK